MNHYYVIAGGIGEVYSGASFSDAELRYNFYVRNSRRQAIDPNSDFIRGVDQPVQFFINGRVYQEHVPAEVAR